MRPNTSAKWCKSRSLELKQTPDGLGKFKTLFKNVRMSKITITDLEVFYHVGVPDEERARPQRLLLTVTMDVDFSAAARSDDLTDTINYFAVSQRLLKFGEGRSWKLIEKLASDIADLILGEYRPAAVTVEVKKFPIPESRFVSVMLTRCRQSSG